MRKSDTGDVRAVNKEMIKALRPSPDVIAKVGNSYKKRFKVASRVTTNGISNFTSTHGRLRKLKMKGMSPLNVASGVEMFPKLPEEIQEQLGSVSKREK